MKKNKLPLGIMAMLCFLLWSQFLLAQNEIFTIEDDTGKVLIAIQENGNVGINTINAYFPLTLNGSMSFYKEDLFYGKITEDEQNLYLHGKLLLNGPNGPEPAKNLILQQSPPLAQGFGPPAGLVGIGTSLPKAKLHVDGNVMIGQGNPSADYELSVHGEIMCEELRVRLNANWPDYVFLKDYPLMTLSDLKNFIARNNHLPDIPNAQSMESLGGVDLGEMNVKLLQKVEELTLYVIQLSDKIEKLKRR